MKEIPVLLCLSYLSLSRVWVCWFYFGNQLGREREERVWDFKALLLAFERKERERQIDGQQRGEKNFQ